MKLLGFVVHCDGNVLLKYTTDLGRLVFHIHCTGVKSNFILRCLVHWSIAHVTFCNIMQHKVINHTEVNKTSFLCMCLEEGNEPNGTVLILWCFYHC